MKDIVCEGVDYGSVKIKLIGGPRPYLGIEVNDPVLSGSPKWHPIPDKDLWRLKRAIDRCLQATTEKP